MVKAISKDLSLLRSESDGLYGLITKDAIASLGTSQNLPLELSPAFAKKLIETKSLPPSL